MDKGEAEYIVKLENKIDDLESEIRELNTTLDRVVEERDQAESDLDAYKYELSNSQEGVDTLKDIVAEAVELLNEVDDQFTELGIRNRLSDKVWDFVKVNR